jgi:uncharacterized protein YndB with AHSA1/START domain
MNGSLDTVDNRPALRLERRLVHPVERVWRAVSEPAELARWFVASIDWRPEAGEVIEAGGQSGEITELEPPRLIAFVWGGELLRLELRPDGDGCLLVLTHVFDDRSLGAQHAAGWEAYLDRLDTHLAGDFMSEQEAHEGITEVHERYAERFGLDPEVGRRTIAAMEALPVTLDDGPTLRLERRYDHPIERVWRAITDPDELRHWFPPGEQLEVTESDPPRVLAGTWHGEALRFELRPDGDGCRRAFSHAFGDRDRAARDAAGWDRCFVRLDGLLEGEPMSEADSLRSWPETHERYAVRFGVDPELGRKAFAEHPTQQ